MHIRASRLAVCSVLAVPRMASTDASWFDLVA
jgi:hypothetical protein